MGKAVHTDKIRHDGFPYQSKVSRDFQAEKSAERDKP